MPDRRRKLIEQFVKRSQQPRARSAMYAPDQGGPPPRPGSSQAIQNRRDRRRARARSQNRSYS